MRKAWPLIVALGLVVAALLFATCGDRRHARPNEHEHLVDGENTPPPPKPAPRKRTDAPVADEKPAEAPASVATSVPSREATTTFTPPDAKVAAPKHVLRGRIVDKKGRP